MKKESNSLTIEYFALVIRNMEIKNSKIFYNYTKSQEWIQIKSMCEITTVTFLHKPFPKKDIKEKNI